MIGTIVQCSTFRTLEASSEPFEFKMMRVPLVFIGHPSLWALIPLKNHRVSSSTSMRQNLNEKCIHNRMHEFNWAWNSVLCANQEWTPRTGTTIFKPRSAQHSKTKIGDQTLHQFFVSNVEDWIGKDSLLTDLGKNSKDKIKGPSAFATVSSIAPFIVTVREQRHEEPKYWDYSKDKHAEIMYIWNFRTLIYKTNSQAKSTLRTLLA